MKKLPVTAIVVSRNEGWLLDECLASLAFCDELVVYNLESTDDTAAIAARHGATLVHHKIVPVVEEIRMSALNLYKYDWILYLDPDERILPALVDAFDAIVRGDNSNVGLVFAPWVFYFKGKRLKGTIWGSERFRPVLHYRNGVVLTQHVHLGTQIKSGFSELRIGNFNNAFIPHYWSNSIVDLFRKHKRYAGREGSSRYNNGNRYPGSYQHARSSLAAAYASYVHFRGYRDGFNGLLLSMLWGWYTFASLSSLREYQNSILNR